VKRGFFNKGNDGFSTFFDAVVIRTSQKRVGAGLYGGFSDFYGLFVG
jgi:hypothetical protein